MEIATPLMATPAPLVETPALETPAVQGPGLPLQFLNQLLQKLGVTRLQSLADLLPAGRILVLALLAVATLGMGIYPKPFTDVMDSSVTELLRHVAQSKLL